MYESSNEPCYGLNTWRRKNLGPFECTIYIFTYPFYVFLRTSICELHSVHLKGGGLRDGVGGRMVKILSKWQVPNSHRWGVKVLWRFWGKVFSVKCTMYSVQCTVNCVQCTVFSVQVWWWLWAREARLAPLPAPHWRTKVPSRTITLTKYQCCWPHPFGKKSKKMSSLPLITF